MKLYRSDELFFIYTELYALGLFSAKFVMERGSKLPVIKYEVPAKFILWG
jgi:hypothetical protein